MKVLTGELDIREVNIQYLLIHGQPGKRFPSFVFHFPKFPKNHCYSAGKYGFNRKLSSVLLPE